MRSVYLSVSLMSARTGRMPSTAWSAKISCATSATPGVRFRYLFQLRRRVLWPPHHLPGLPGTRTCGDLLEVAEDAHHLRVAQHQHAFADQTIGHGLERFLHAPVRQPRPTRSSLHGTQSQHVSTSSAAVSGPVLPRFRTAPAECDPPSGPVPALRFLTQLASVADLVPALLLGLANSGSRLSLTYLMPPRDLLYVPDGAADRAKSGTRSAAPAPVGTVHLRVLQRYHPKRARAAKTGVGGPAYSGCSTRPPKNPSPRRTLVLLPRSHLFKK